ncbi:MAG TPA: T9SS type A sorting domain-containing protein, partial [Bacteroidales bacterium]|nr:T9SS type A sorting domain-containing protein [Bacteroidales bacterium]
DAGKDLELVADSSGLYRVKYVNSNGVASTQLFSIAVDFHINVEPVGPAYSIADGPVENNAHVRVLAGQSVALMPVLKSGWEGGSWMWSDGSKEETLVLEQIGEAREVSVVYTLDGEDFELSYRISVLPFEGAFGYWPMDEGEGAVVNDVWAGNNAEKLVGGWTNGIAQGGIFLMDAASSYLQFPTGFIRPLREFSISIWVKPVALEGWMRAWDFGRGTDFNMFLTLSAEGNDRPFRFAIKAGGAEEQINTSEVLETGKWAHLTVTRSGSTGLMYLNGTEVGRNSNMTLFPADLGLTDQNYVGKSQWPDPMFNGVVDELRIYSKALSPNEVLALTNLIVPEIPVHLPAYREGGPQSKLREDTWIIWPNPVETDLRIALVSDSAHDLEIGIFDSSGTQLALVTKQEEDSYVVEMGGLPAGVYFVAVQYGSRRFVNKVIKVN